MSLQEFLLGPKSSGHMTLKACRCRLHDRERGGGWRLAGGEPLGHGSTTVSIGSLSLAVIWPTSFTGSFVLLPRSWWSYLLASRLTCSSDRLDPVRPSDSSIRPCRTAGLPIYCKRSSPQFGARSRRPSSTCIRTTPW